MASIDLKENDKANFKSDIDSKIFRPQGRYPTGPVPSSYVCNKCHVKGHWIHECPGIIDKNGRCIDSKLIRRPTGIPTTYLTEVEAETPNSYLTSDGRYVISTATLMALERSGTFIRKKAGNEEQIEKNNLPISPITSVRYQDSNSFPFDMSSPNKSDYGDCVLIERFEEKEENSKKCFKNQLLFNVDQSELMNETIPEWSLDKLLEKEITEIIMMDKNHNNVMPDAELTEDIFNLSNTGNKIMLTENDYAAARAKKVESFLKSIRSNSYSAVMNCQEISVVNFSISDSNEDQCQFDFGSECYMNGFVGISDDINTDKLGMFCQEDDVFLVQEHNDVLKMKEDVNDILQRQLENEFLNRITNKPFTTTKDKCEGCKHAGRNACKSNHASGRSIHRNKHHHRSKYGRDNLDREQYKKDDHSDRYEKARYAYSNSRTRSDRHKSESERSRADRYNRKEAHKPDREPRKHSYEKDRCRHRSTPRSRYYNEKHSKYKSHEYYSREPENRKNRSPVGSHRYRPQTARNNDHRNRQKNDHIREKVRSKAGSPSQSDHGHTRNNSSKHCHKELVEEIVISDSSTPVKSDERKAMNCVIEDDLWIDLFADKTVGNKNVSLIKANNTKDHVSEKEATKGFVKCTRSWELCKDKIRKSSSNRSLWTEDYIYEKLIVNSPSQSELCTRDGEMD